MFDDLRGIVPSQIRRSYAAKFGIVLLIIGVSVGLIGSAATIQITNEVQSGVNDDFRTFASQESTTVENWMERGRETTLLVSQADSLQGTRASAGEYMTRQRDQLANVFQLHLVDKTSGEIVTSTTMTQGTSAPDRPWADRLGELSSRDTSDVIATDAYSVGEVSLVAFASDVGANSNRVLVVTYRTGSIAAEFQGSDRTEGGFTQVVSSSGSIIADESGEFHLEQYAGQEALARASELRGTNDTQIVSAGSNEVIGEEHIVGVSPVEGTDWVVLVHAPKDQAYGFVTAVSQFGLLATIAGVLLITILGAVLGRNTASAIDRLTAKTQRMEEGDLSVDFETERIDNIGRLYAAFGSMRDALQEQIQEAQQARQEAEQARERAEMINQHLVEKADEYSEIMREVAEGDLSKRLDPESRNEAMEEIAIEFNEMIAEIEQTTETVKAFATEVATSSEEVTASSEEVKSASEQVTDSVQEISDGAERQNEKLQQVSEEMSSLSTTIEEIASSANEVADLSQQTAETGDDARENAEEAIDEMEQVEAEADATVEAMGRLQRQMAEIEEITDFISEVAEQTNILALNANIEAARAGEAGEGFAVVAEEVKGLAEETRQAAEEIDQLIEDIQGQTERTAEEVQQTSDEVAQSVEIVEQTVDSLEEIAGYAAETNTGIQEISDATTEQASSTNQVVGMVDEAASISEQTSRESENVAAAAEEQTTALTQVTNSASDLAEQASRLSTALERFNTETDAGDDDGGIDVEPTEPADGFDEPVDDATDDGFGDGIDDAVEPPAASDADRSPDAGSGSATTGEPDPATGPDDDAREETDAETAGEPTVDVDELGKDIVDEVLGGSAEDDPTSAFEDGENGDDERSTDDPGADAEETDAEETDAGEGDGAEGDDDEGGSDTAADDEPAEDDVPDAIDEWLDAQSRVVEDIPDDVDADDD